VIPFLKNRRTFLAMKKSGFPFFLFTFLGAIVVLPSQAQEPAYLHYTVNDGLPSAVVYCAVQDDKGFMWFGTDKGLVRFDGTRFKVYGMKDGLPDNEVVNIFKDSKGRIWLSCFGQHPVYYKDGVITSADTDTMLAKVKRQGISIFSKTSSSGFGLGPTPDTYTAFTIKA
jgi:ligand-binding sensor domain-containing protein